jgi:hypothetical protein
VRARSSNWIEQGTPNAYNRGFCELHSVATSESTRRLGRIETLTDGFGFYRLHRNCTAERLATAGTERRWRAV